MTEAMAKKTQLNHQRLMKNIEDNKKQAKEDQKKYCDQVEYD